MLTYQATKTQTCPALGWQTYLSNEFFQLKAYAEAACTSCEASYVTMVSQYIRLFMQWVNAGELYTLKSQSDGKITNI